MTETGPGVVGLAAEDVCAWLVGRVAGYLDEPARGIDPEVPLAEYGLDSVYVFTLCGEIEDALGVVVEPTLIWDVENLAILALHIAEAGARRSRGGQVLGGRGEPGDRPGRTVDPGRPGPVKSGS